MLKEMLLAAVALGYTITVVDFNEDEAGDYSGRNVDEAMDAIDAVDEIEVIIGDEDDMCIGTAAIVNGLDEDERIMDSSGWVTRWLDDNA